ncbi:caspase family protein [bacterium]|nr:MAG: caspase family protein [bacterium]
MLRALSLALATVLAASASAQAWQKAYDEGLQNARRGAWKQARESFLAAAKDRPNDSSKPTPLFGPITERRTWRDGAPYSANLLAAYSGMRVTTDLTGDERTALLKQVTTELEALIQKKQAGQLALLTLVEAYNRLGDTQSRARLQNTPALIDQSWREDLEIVSPETPGLPVQTRPPTTNPPTSTPTTTPPPAGNQNTVYTNPTTHDVPPIAGGVPILPNKYALIIGNRESRLPGGNLEYAEDDAIRIRESLQNYAGYAPENVQTVLNGTAESIRSAATALANRIGEDAVVMIYFTGVGTNLGGKDYLAGVDTALATDVESMVAKEELYRAFFVKGATVFAFFQANRPMVNNRVFGEEIPATGSICQMQATLAEGTVGFAYQNSRPVGLFTDAFVRALEKFRTNQVPISEFGWEVFYSIRRRATGSSTGTGSGSSLQTPTVPSRTGMAADARF